MKSTPPEPLASHLLVKLGLGASIGGGALKNVHALRARKKSPHPTQNPATAPDLNLEPLIVTHIFYMAHDDMVEK